ncbi:hypothetical protein C8R46DRAFT_898893 [Mycena filopes]|nr:hypothetical protein C8R46DRAFT_898893 [Mycena filopes]
MDAGPSEIKKVRAYKRIVPLPIPTIPSVPLPLPPATSTQPRLQPPGRSKFQKVDDVLATYGFKSLGDFLTTLFYHHHRADGLDPRTPRHKAVVTSFLQGASKQRMAGVIQLIYDHPQSRPKRNQPERNAAAFSPHEPLSNILSARPCLSAWAARTVGDEAYRRVGQLAAKSDDPTNNTHIRASTNGRKEGTRVATWDDMRFSVQDLATKYREADPLVWYLTECFSAPRVNGKVVVRKRRPHPAIQVGAISAFILSRNTYASGDLALPLGVWHFICKSHVDVKRVYSRFGSIVSSTTAQNALNSMSENDLLQLQVNTRAAAARGEAAYFKISDNIQEYSPVYEHGLGRENQLKVGIACTAVRYDDVVPGAFDANDHVARVLKEERQTMTAESVWETIDWEHNDNIRDLHFVRVLAEFSPHLSFLQPEISERFRTTLAKHRIPLRKKVLQPTGTNTERQLTSQGMQRGRVDADTQRGIEPEKHDNILDWDRGDGAGHATTMNLKKYLVTEINIYDSFRNVISTPETWHTKSTDLNSCAANHYGPTASKDPSSLSRSSNAANMKRPTDLKKCDFYPTSRSMTMIWEARVLDCWRIILGVDSDIHLHFEELAELKCLPTLEDLLEHAANLRERFASQPAYDRSLSKAEYDETSADDKAPTGSPWIARSAPEAEPDPPPTPPPAPEPTTKPADGPKVHTEPPKFDGDRVLSNAILFLMEFGWWLELNYAIPEGDIGRVLEILKIYIFTFAGTANQNYMRYMLDLYALLQFECSPALKQTLLNNWLISLQGILGTFIEGDLMQEHFNRWLEDMVRRRGGEFDDKFYRKTIAPNVQRFLGMKDDVETAFDLKPRSKTHTSPHLREETKILLRMYKEEELHLFRTKRSMGHAAVNRIDRGLQRLEGGKMAEYLQQGAEYASMLRGVEKLRSASSGDQMALDSDNSPPSPPMSPPPHRSTPEVERPPSSSSTQSSSSTHSIKSFYSSCSVASRAAADSVEWWDNEDHSDEPLTSDSDLAVTIDPETGRMSADWYEEEAFENVLTTMFGEDIDLQDSDEEAEDVPTWGPEFDSDSDTEVDENQKGGEGQKVGEYEEDSSDEEE